MEVGILLVVLLLVGYQIYAYRYFRSPEFLAIRKDISEYNNDCNALNEHIEELKYMQSHAAAMDYGKADLSDTSRYNFKRSNWSKSVNTKHVHNCSASICKKAGEQPFKYLCKYFNIKSNESTLSNYESMFNDFAAAEQGKRLLVQKKKTSCLPSRKEYLH